MDPNTVREWMMTTLQSEQTFISSLSLFFTGILFVVTIWTIIVGLVFQRRHSEVIAELRLLKEAVSLENRRIEDIKRSYSLIERELQLATKGSELLQQRELLDMTICSIDKERATAEDFTATLEHIISAMSSVSITKELEDIKRLVRIFDLATKRGLEKLAENAIVALRRATKS
ncbi:MAG: hypothetical protein GY845_16140 [Planctomycetes bacterium]|nr:hypothetical protein [Planctomycetota bacterium]